MKAILALLALSFSLVGAPTTIMGPITQPVNGQPFIGKIVVGLNAGVSQPLYTLDGATLSGTETTIAVTDGTVSVQLQPNDAIVPPGTSYRVRYLPTVGPNWTETWVVPISASPVSIAAVRVNAVPTPIVTIQPGQLARAGAYVGQALVWDGKKWAPPAIWPPYKATFTNVTTATVTRAQHGFAHNNLLVFVYDANGLWIAPWDIDTRLWTSIRIDPSTGTVTVVFPSARNFGVQIHGVSAGGTANLSFPLSGGISTTITQTQHGLAVYPWIQMYDSSGYFVFMDQEKVAVTVNSLTFDISIATTPAKAGRVVLSAR